MHRIDINLIIYSQFSNSLENIMPFYSKAFKVCHLGNSILPSDIQSVNLKELKSKFDMYQSVPQAKTLFDVVIIRNKNSSGAGSEARSKKELQEKRLEHCVLPKQGGTQLER